MSRWLVKGLWWSGRRSGPGGLIQHGFEIHDLAIAEEVRRILCNFMPWPSDRPEQLSSI